MAYTMLNKDIDVEKIIMMTQNIRSNRKEDKNWPMEDRKKTAKEHEV